LEGVTTYTAQENQVLQGADSTGHSKTGKISTTRVESEPLVK